MKSVVSKKETPTEWVKTMIAERVKGGLIQKKLSPLQEENPALERLLRNNKDNFTSEISRPESVIGNRKL